MGTGGFLLRRVRARVADKPTGFVWVEIGRIAASGMPSSRSQLLWLQKQGVQSVLTLTEKPLPLGWTEGVGMKYLHVPMKDHSPPDQQSLMEAVNLLDSELSAGRVVLVHCLAGQGRTGCVLAAHYISQKGGDAEEAVKELRKVKDTFVEEGQEASLVEFARKAARRDPPA